MQRMLSSMSIDVGLLVNLPVGPVEKSTPYDL